MNKSPEELITELVGFSTEALTNLCVKIRRSDEKSRYRLLDPAIKDGICDALDCYAQVFNGFPVSIAGHSQTMHALDLLQSSWDDFFNELAEELDASPTCETARAAQHALHKQFIAVLRDPNTKAGDEYSNFTFTLSKLSSELQFKIRGDVGSEHKTMLETIKAGWTPKLQRKFEALQKQLSDESTPEQDVVYIHFCAFDYIHRLMDWVPYLRGESSTRPDGIRGPDKVIRHIGEWMTSTIMPCIVEPMQHLVENLPTLNNPDRIYPLQQINDMFGAISMMLTLMNLCEEEGKSTEGSHLGLASIKAYELMKVMCPKEIRPGHVNLETKLIGEAYIGFRKWICNAAWALSTKVNKRDSGKIDLSDGLAKLNAEAYNPETEDAVLKSQNAAIDLSSLPTKADLAAAVKDINNHTDGVIDKLGKTLIRCWTPLKSGATKLYNLIGKAIEKKSKLTPQAIGNAIADKYANIDMPSEPHREQFRAMVDYSESHPITPSSGSRMKKHQSGLSFYKAALDLCQQHSEWTSEKGYYDAKGLGDACDKATKRPPSNKINFTLAT